MSGMRTREEMPHPNYSGKSPNHATGKRKKIVIGVDTSTKAPGQKQTTENAKIAKRIEMLGEISDAEKSGNVYNALRLAVEYKMTETKARLEAE